jgi:hypothetical protein
VLLLVSGERLEQLDQVAGRVVEQDLTHRDSGGGAERTVS